MIFYFNPRPPRGGRHGAICRLLHFVQSFQSTPPARGATFTVVKGPGLNFAISIHAPREGGDGGNAPSGGHCCVFQSTPPARGATYVIRPYIGYSGFQSTPPARGATISAVVIPGEDEISIHAPREGGD